MNPNSSFLSLLSESATIALAPRGEKAGQQPKWGEAKHANGGRAPQDGESNGRPRAQRLKLAANRWSSLTEQTVVTQTCAQRCTFLLRSADDTMTTGPSNSYYFVCACPPRKRHKPRVRIWNLSAFSSHT